SCTLHESVKTVVGPVRVHVRGNPELVEYEALTTFSAGDPAELKSAGEVNSTAAKLHRAEAVPLNVVLAHEPRGLFIGLFIICMYGGASNPLHSQRSRVL